MDVDAAIRAIGEPRRREILRLVGDAERSSGEIASHFDITGPAVSQHLKVLREAGLVNERRDGTRHLFSANRLALRALRDHLAWMWDDSLADLKRSAETEARPRKRSSSTATGGTSRSVNSTAASRTTAERSDTCGPGLSLYEPPRVAG